MKVYVLSIEAELECGYYIRKIFSDKNKAIDKCDLLNKLDSKSYYIVEEFEVDGKIDITNYYSHNKKETHPLVMALKEC